MPKYQVGDILKVKPIDRTDRAWYFLVTKISKECYYYFYLDNGDDDWSSIDGVDNSERISLHD